MHKLASAVANSIHNCSDLFTCNACQHAGGWIHSFVLAWNKMLLIDILITRGVSQIPRSHLALKEIFFVNMCCYENLSNSDVGDLHRDILRNGRPPVLFSKAKVIHIIFALHIFH